MRMEVFSFLSIRNIAKSGIYRLTKIDKEEFLNWEHRRSLEANYWKDEGPLYPRYNGVYIYIENIRLSQFSNELIQWSIQFS